MGVCHLDRPLEWPTDDGVKPGALDKALLSRLWTKMWSGPRVRQGFVCAELWFKGSKWGSSLGFGGVWLGGAIVQASITSSRARGLVGPWVRRGVWPGRAMPQNLPRFLGSKCSGFG